MRRPNQPSAGRISEGSRSHITVLPCWRIVNERVVGVPTSKYSGTSSSVTVVQLEAYGSEREQPLDPQQLPGVLARGR